MNTTEKDLNGLGGWLILVGFGVVMSPIRQIINWGESFGVFFKEGVWQSLTTPGSAYYIQYLGTIVVLEIIMSSLLIIASIYLIRLFFIKSYKFPTLFVTIMLSSLFIACFDIIGLSIMVPNESAFISANLIPIIGIGIQSTIWIWYIWVSKRVAATFIK